MFNRSKPSGRQPQPSGMPPSARQGTSATNNPPPNHAGPRRPSKLASRLAVASALVRVLITLGVCVFLAFFILASASDLFGLNQEDHPYEIEIPEGMNMKQVADVLAEKGVIDQKLTFRIYAGVKAKDLEIVPGNYIFNSDMSYDQIFTMLKTGNIEDSIVELTFIEGMTLDDIAKLLEENKVCSADSFLEYLQSDEFATYRFYNLLPDEELLYLHLEGYIFPDTYQFYVGERVDQVAKKFLDNFNRHLTPEIINRAETINMSIHEVITLASIIQKEAGDPLEMNRVSSVFHNRLDNPGSYPQLQSDVTIFYVEKHMKGKSRPYTIPATQEVYDAYNTYVCKGLPVGPVCNPGIDAIKAALYPEETDLYYFVTDINGEYYYASTLAEHMNNIALAEEQDPSGNGAVGGGVLTHEPDADIVR